MPNQNSGERTKNMLAASLRKLMKKKSLDKIKIREIVDDCGVNRQTFYYHFQDIYALVEWIYKRDAEKLVSDYSEGDSWRTIVAKVLEYAEANREEIMCVLNSKAKSYFSKFVYESSNFVFQYFVDAASKDADVDEDYKKFVSSFYSLAACGVVEQWIKNSGSSRLSVDELIDMIATTLEGNISASIERRMLVNQKEGC